MTTEGKGVIKKDIGFYKIGTYINFWIVEFNGRPLYAYIYPINNKSKTLAYRLTIEDFKNSVLQSEFVDILYRDSQ